MIRSSSQDCKLDSICGQKTFYFREKYNCLLFHTLSSASINDLCLVKRKRCSYIEHILTIDEKEIFWQFILSVREREYEREGEYKREIVSLHFWASVQLSPLTYFVNCQWERKRQEGGRHQVTHSSSFIQSALLIIKIYWHFLSYTHFHRTQH